VKGARLILAVALLHCGCSALPTEHRHPSKAQVVSFGECRGLSALKSFEIALFQEGFTREPSRESPVPFELVESLMTGKPTLSTYVKTDYEPQKSGSAPYREFPNRYKIVPCAEPGEHLYLVVVRHDPVTGDAFLGDRMTEALKRTGCAWKIVAPTREIGFFKDTTEEDILRHARRGQCRDYAHAK
jgi:hypothetical protein